MLIFPTEKRSPSSGGRWSSAALMARTFVWLVCLRRTLLSGRFFAIWAQICLAQTVKVSSGAGGKRCGGTQVRRCFWSATMASALRRRRRRGKVIKPTRGPGCRPVQHRRINNNRLRHSLKSPQLVEYEILLTTAADTVTPEIIVRHRQ